MEEPVGARSSVVVRVTSALRDLDDAERLHDQILGAFETASAEEGPVRSKLTVRGLRAVKVGL